MIDICFFDSFYYDVVKVVFLVGKYVYCEKLLVDMVVEVCELVDIVKEKGVIICVGYVFLCNFVYDFVKEIIDVGEIGEIKFFKVC